jgi:hypothetical protein
MLVQRFLEVRAGRRSRLLAAEARLRPPQVVARLRRRQLSRRLLVRLRLVHMLTVEVLVERRPQAPAAVAPRRSPLVMARLRRRRGQLLLPRPVHMLAVEVLLGPQVLQWMRRRRLLRSLRPPEQQKLGLLLCRWLNAAVNRVLIVCITRSDCAAIPFGDKRMPNSRHRVLRAAIGSCRIAGAE